MSHEPAAAPAVRQHGEREPLVRHEQEQRLVARDRALVVERRSVRRRRAPTSRGRSPAPSACDCGSRISARVSLESGPRPPRWCAPKRSRSADRRPEPAGRPPRGRIGVDAERTVPGFAFLHVAAGRSLGLLEAGRREPERLDDPLSHRRVEGRARRQGCARCRQPSSRHSSTRRALALPPAAAPPAPAAVRRCG